MTLTSPRRKHWQFLAGAFAAFALGTATFAHAQSTISHDILEINNEYIDEKDITKKPLSTAEQIEKLLNRERSQPQPASKAETPEGAVREAVASNGLEQKQVVKRFFSAGMNSDYERAGKVKRNCYGSGWDGDLFSTFMAETDLKIEAAAEATTKDGRSSVVTAKMDVTIDDGRHFKPVQTFMLVLENGVWKIDDIRYGDGRTIHAFFREIVSNCK